MRLFVAVWPPDDVRALVAALARPAVPGVRWTSPEQWHVTLRFLGSADADDVGARLRTITVARTPAVAGPATECLGAGVLCLPVTGLETIAAAVVEATASVGRPPEVRPFRGHLTLARAGRGARRDALRRLAGAELRAEWDVENVTLVSSELRAGGARYRTLARVPLA